MWGIATDELPHVFERFYQGDASSTRQRGGTGIGLALAKELVERHGGSIDVESQPGFGTSFLVRLPLGTDHLAPEDLVEEGPEETVPDVAHREEALIDTEESPQPEAGQETKPPEGAATVLIVEDNADMRAYLRSHLAARYHVIEAVDGVDGLEKARTVDPALILSDVMMPEMDGYAFVEQVRQDPGKSWIPILFLSAKGQSQDRVKGRTTGADVYMVKPFEPEELVAQVESSLKQASRLIHHQTKPGGGAPTIQVPFDVELTPTELKVVQFVARGMANREIAEELKVSQRTIESHVSNMLGKTGLHNRTELARWAMENNKA